MEKLRRNKFAGFTLLELLVVIAIISMLMSITLPSLKRAKESAKGVVCQSDIRQLNIAWNAYATDNDDKMCAADTLWIGQRPWDGAYESQMMHFWVSDGVGSPYNEFCGTETAVERGILWPYLGLYDSYTCKSDISGFARSYAISHAMGSIYNINGERNFYRTAGVTRPSEKLVFIEYTMGPRKCCGIIGGAGRDGFLAIDTYSKTWIKDACRLTDRHNGGCSMSFADGHVERWKWQDKRTIDLEDGQCAIVYEDSSVNNADLDRLLPAIRGARDRQY